LCIPLKIINFAPEKRMIYTEVAEARGQRYSMLFKDSRDLISIMRYNLLNITILPPPPSIISTGNTRVIWGFSAHYK
jgi:hypothetical protein